MKKNVHQPTYRSWQMMKNRCLNPNATDFAYYGARGITVPSSWLTYEGFVASMGLRPDGTTLDRRDNKRSYSRNNCRWADKRTQSRNRNYTLNITYRGQTLKTWEWAEKLRILPTTLHHRLWRHRRNTLTYDAVFTPNSRNKT